MQKVLNNGFAELSGNDLEMIEVQLINVNS